MPIKREDFEEAQLPLDDRILRYLGEDPDRACDLAEVVAGVERTDLQTAQMLMLLEMRGTAEAGLARRYSEALERLIGSGRIVSASLAGRTYYGLPKR